jgi:Tfp pilus assembly protein PilX
MKGAGTIRLAPTEAGIALLISIFVLLLISVVAIALIVSSGTETSLAGNYRSSTGVYYAALSGIEEARGRLSIQDPNSFKTTWATFYSAPGSTLPIGTVGYILNPGQKLQEACSPPIRMRNTILNLAPERLPPRLSRQRFLSGTELR